MKNPIVVFDRDVKSSEIREVFKQYDGDIVINGQLIIDDNAGEDYICCEKIYVNGIDAYANCDISIKGEIVSHGNICVCYMSVEGDIYCMGDFNSTRLNVIGDICATGEFRAVNLRHKGELIALNVSIGG